MTRSNLVSGVSTEAPYRRFCLRSNATDTTPFCLLWLSASVLIISTEFRINRNGKLYQRVPNAAAFDSGSLAAVQVDFLELK
jgi:hypothetical protein